MDECPTENNLHYRLAIWCEMTHGRSGLESGPVRSGLAGPAGDIAALTGRLDRVRVVVLAHERDGLGARDAYEDGQARQGGTDASVAACAGDLDPFGRGALPGLGQCGEYLGLDGRQPEVRPPEPARLPGHGGRAPPEQVDAEGRDGTVRQRAAEPAAPHQPAGGQAQDTWCRTVPCLAHKPDRTHSRGRPDSAVLQYSLRYLPRGLRSLCSVWS